MILVIVLLIRRIRPSKGSGRETDLLAESALEILKKRYARGEINKEEYLAKKKDLE
jgi:putative membrane protein